MCEMDASHHELLVEQETWVRAAARNFEMKSAFSLFFLCLSLCFIQVLTSRVRPSDEVSSTTSRINLDVVVIHQPDSHLSQFTIIAIQCEKLSASFHSDSSHWGLVIE